MEASIHNSLRFLIAIYIIHIIVIVICFIFNFSLINKIYWLKEILEHIYFIGILSSIILFIQPIIILLFIFFNKLKKNNLIILKIFTVIYCLTVIIFGFFFSGILMLNAIESPEFCKECPFNLPLQEINSLIKSNDLNNKCKERRCVINTVNYEIIKNEDDLYEYLCNYNPASEFEEIKESRDNLDTNSNNINTTEKISDNIICNKISKSNLIISDLENNLVYNYYDKCNSYTEFYLCERNRFPNKFDLKENFICPGTNYMNKLVIYCMLDIVLNLIINFIPAILEYHKFVEMLRPQRRIIPKSNSFSSTLHSSQIAENKSETKDKYVRNPTEIIIVCSNNNININNIDNNNDNKKEENNIDNEIVIKKSKNKKIKFTPNVATETEKSKTGTKSIEIIMNINNIKIMKKLKGKKEEEIKDKKTKDKKTIIIEEADKITISNNDNTFSTKRIFLPGIK